MNHSDSYTNEYSLILKPSLIPGAGVGVFATHPIAKDVRIITAPKYFRFRRMKFEQIPPLFRDYCIAEADNWYRCPLRFNRMEIGWFINHSFEPNVGKKGNEGLHSLVAIKEGDEIVIDYNILNEPLEKKEPYYLLTS